VLAADPACFDAQLALGMAHYRRGDYAAAIAEGLKAEQLRPRTTGAHESVAVLHEGRRQTKSRTARPAGED
jgi:Flp pilus assembly protein TadD